MLPNPGLIHSLTAPGGLLALQDLSCPLSVHSCHFTRTPNHFSARVGVPDSQFNAFFFSSEDTFLSASKVSLSPARPVLQLTRCWEVCVSLQAACWILFVCTAGFFFHLLFYTKSKHTAVPSLFKLKISSIRPVRSVSPLSHSHYTCLRLLWCNQPIGQETTVSSDCASSRLETSWAELYCHIITP